MCEQASGLLAQGKIIRKTIINKGDFNKVSTTNMIRTMKEVHPTKILLVKIGKFYHAYGKDSYILAFLFNYQIKKVETNVNTVGFPEMALNKVLKTLEDKNIDYIVLEKASNYEVISEEEFKDKNQYSELYNKAHRYIVRKNKIDAIYEHLISNISDETIKEKINSIEEILYD